jgi:hypothetical protein
MYQNGGDGKDLQQVRRTIIPGTLEFGLAFDVHSVLHAA